MDFITPSVTGANWCSYDSKTVVLKILYILDISAAETLSVGDMQVDIIIGDNL